MKTSNYLSGQEYDYGARQTLAFAGRVLPRSGFGKNVAIVASASFVSQAMLILASPLITRLYSPEDFGVFTVFTSLVSILTVPACWRYEQAIALPDDDREAANVLGLAIVALLATVMVVTFGLVCFGSQIASVTHTSSVEPYFWLVPLSLLGTGAYQALSSWTIREKSFSVLGRSRLSQSAAQLIAHVALGWIIAGPIGLLFGNFCGRIAGTVSLARKSATACQIPSPATVARLAKRYRRFPVFSAPAALLSSLAQNLTPLILAALFGPITAGLFALVHRTLSVPVNVVSTAVGQVYLAESARIGRDRHQQKSLYWSVLRKMLVVSSPLLLISLFDWRAIVGLIFGEQWTDAAGYVRPITLTCYAVLVASPLGSVLDVAERQDLHLFRETLSIFIAALIGLGAATGNASALATVQMLCAGSVLNYIAYAGFSLWAIMSIPAAPSPGSAQE